MLSRVYAKDWVSGYQVPDDGVIQEGRNAIDFLLKRCAPIHPRSMFPTNRLSLLFSGLHLGVGVIELTYHPYSGCHGTGVTFALNLGTYPQYKPFWKF